MVFFRNRQKAFNRNSSEYESEQNAKARSIFRNRYIYSVGRARSGSVSGVMRIESGSGGRGEGGVGSLILRRRSDFECPK